MHGYQELNHEDTKNLTSDVFQLGKLMELGWKFQLGKMKVLDLPIECWKRDTQTQPLPPVLQPQLPATRTPPRYPQSDTPPSHASIQATHQRQPTVRNYPRHPSALPPRTRTPPEVPQFPSTTTTPPLRSALPSSVHARTAGPRRARTSARCDRLLLPPPLPLPRPLPRSDFGSCRG
jgi:hypothetical protein